MTIVNSGLKRFRDIPEVNAVYTTFGFIGVTDIFWSASQIFKEFETQFTTI